MERKRRTCKPSKAAAALDDIRAVRAGERKALDTLESDDDAPDELDYEEQAQNGAMLNDIAVPSKRKQGGGRPSLGRICSPFSFLVLLNVRCPG
jgi:hypothetical protein